MAATFSSTRLDRLETRNGNDRAAPRPQPAKRALRERAPITRQDRTPRVELAASDLADARS